MRERERERYEIRVIVTRERERERERERGHRWWYTNPLRLGFSVHPISVLSVW